MPAPGIGWLPGGQDPILRRSQTANEGCSLPAEYGPRGSHSRIARALSVDSTGFLGRRKDTPSGGSRCASRNTSISSASIPAGSAPIFLCCPCGPSAGVSSSRFRVLLTARDVPRRLHPLELPRQAVPLSRKPVPVQPAPVIELEPPASPFRRVQCSVTLMLGAIQFILNRQ